MAGSEGRHKLRLDRLVAVRRPDDRSLALKERFGRAAERMSVFRLVGSAQEARTRRCT